MAGSSHARLLGPASDCRSCPDLAVAGRFRGHSYSRFTHEAKSVKATVASYALSSSRIFKFPPNFVRQLSTKARRNCSNIGVAQVVAASWSNNSSPFQSAAAASANAVDAAAAAAVPATSDAAALEGSVGTESLKVEEGLGDSRTSVFDCDGSVAIHAGERFGRGRVDDAITTPVVNTSAYFFKKTADLLDFKVLTWIPC
ncbi:cystathionine gamma-synthase 1, chloroplastic-like [Cucurbita pepo subsp. pepo]|uniref:cystathionine gamma-synthase 1, chloroplastic-like n=1 Tax=Cucurbita pepo subsp. pepo TaxID=3664 RepID=UPI000C9D4DC7|nr:cystathionine gamma-synthase 1, chloroplastic-like [Cucurbita pepo subsp. pepo]